MKPLKHTIELDLNTIKMIVESFNHPGKCVHEVRNTETHTALIITR